MAQKKIFRKVMLDRLSSPEQLDTLMRVTSPKGWIALIALICILVMAGLWGVFGTIPTKVHGTGIMVSSGGVHNVASTSAGQITDISVKNDDFVQKGQVIARISQPKLVQKINNTVSTLKKAKTSTKVKPQEIAELKANIQSMREQLNEDSRVVSPYTGQVVEVKTSPGEFVDIGTSVISIEQKQQKSKDLQVVLYVPVHQGEKINPGMDVNVLPASTTKEENGFILGKVSTVSNFPVTLKRMTETLGNAELAQSMLRNGPMVEVDVDLERSGKDNDQFKWSTGKTPPIQMTSGTLSSGAITIDVKRPISLALPIGK